MELIERVRVFKSEESNLAKDLAEYFKNYNEPLEDRWHLFIESRDLLPGSSWTVDIHEIEANDGNYYDDFYYERYQTVDLVDLVVKIEDSPTKSAKFNVDIVKEQILESGYGSFIFDW